MEVIDEGGGLVGFKFYNDVGEASSIADVYFDDDSLLGGSGITDSGVGVAFSRSGHPPDLPGGGGPCPFLTSDHLFDSVSGRAVWRQQFQTEWVEITVQPAAEGETTQEDDARWGLET